MWCFCSAAAGRKAEESFYTCGMGVCIHPVGLFAQPRTMPCLFPDNQDHHKALKKSLYFCAHPSSISYASCFPWRPSRVGLGTVLLAESGLAGHRSVKSWSVCVPGERHVDPSTACKPEHGCFPGHHLKANIWLARLWHSRYHPSKRSMLAGARCEGMEMWLTARHSLQASGV